MDKNEIDKRLKAIAKSREMKLTEIQQVWATAKERMPKAPDRLVLNAVMTQLRERPAFATTKRAFIGHFIGFMVGDVGLRDKAEEMRDKAERTIDRYGFDVALEKGLVNAAGEVLDSRPKVFGRKNPRYGQVLGVRAKIRSHRLYFLCKQARDKKWELAHLQTNDNGLALAWCNLPYYRWVTFPALVQAHDSTGYRLTGSTAKGTLTVFKAVKEERDPYNVYEEVFKPQITPIRKVESYHEAVKEAWDRWIVCYGVIGQLGLERETMFGIPGRLLDTDIGYEAEGQVRFYIPEHIKINCGVYSEAYIFGRTRRSKYRDRETGKLVDADVVIDVWGMFPNPKLTMEPTVDEYIEEEQIEGFIPLE